MATKKVTKKKVTKKKAETDGREVMVIKASTAIGTRDQYNEIKDTVEASLPFKTTSRAFFSMLIDGLVKMPNAEQIIREAVKASLSETL